MKRAPQRQRESRLPRRWRATLSTVLQEISWSRKRGLRLGEQWISSASAEAMLRQHVYETHFARWRAPPPGAAAKFASGDPAFVERVALAATDAWMWEPGWEVIQSAGTFRFVHNGFLQLFVDANTGILPPRARVNRKVAVCMPCVREGLMPGFLYAFSRAGAIDPGAPHVRVYLNLRVDRAASVFNTLLHDAPFTSIPFEMKIPNDPALFQRCDALVIYVGPAEASTMTAALAAMKQESARGWGARTPFAALELKPGLAVAESPPLRDGESRSFGLHRSELLAKAALASVQVRSVDAEQMLSDLLREDGIEPEHPQGHRLPAALWHELEVAISGPRHRRASNA